MIRDPEQTGILAWLEAGGFENQSFAKLLNHKVSAKGDIRTEGNRKLLLVNGLGGMKQILTLEPEGFPVQTFPRYLGHIVEVKGTSDPDAPAPRMRVREIDNLADTCAAR